MNKKISIVFTIILTISLLNKYFKSAYEYKWEYKINMPLNNVLSGSKMYLINQNLERKISYENYRKFH